MADINLSTSIDAIKTKILNSAASATVEEISSYARAARAAGLDQDSAVETAINDRVTTLASTGTPEEVRKLSATINQIRNAPVTSSILNNTDQLSEGTENLYYTDARVDARISNISVPADISELTDTTGLLTQTSISVVASIDNVPSTNSGNAGDLVYVEGGDKLFIHSGSGWDYITITQNQPPTIPTGYFTNIDLELDGTPTVIQLQATDPEGFALSWSYSESDVNQNICTIDLTGSTLTLTPTTDISIEGSFNLTVYATDNSGNSVSDIFEVKLVRAEVYAHYQLNQGTNTDIYFIGSEFGTADVSSYTYGAGTWKYFVLGEGGNGGWSHYGGGGSGYATIGQFTATGDWTFNAQMPTFRTTANEDINSNSNASGVGSLSVTRFSARLVADNSLIGEWSAQPGGIGQSGSNGTGGDGTSGGGGGGNSGAGGDGGTGGANGTTGATYAGGNGIGSAAFELRRAHLESMLQSVDSAATVTAGAGGLKSSGTSHGGGGGGGGFVVTGSSVLPNYNGEDAITTSAKTPAGGGAGWGGGGGATGYDGTRGVGGFGTGGLIVIAKV